MAGNSLVIIIVAYIFNYFMIYRKYKIWGDLLFIGISTFFMMSANGNETYRGVGMLLIAMSLLITIMDISDAVTQGEGKRGRR